METHRHEFGVEPICRALSAAGVPIAPSTYYAARSRPPSPRAVRDEAVLAQIRRVHANRQAGRGLYGANKVYKHLRRERLAGVAEAVGLGRSHAVRWSG